MIAVGYPPLLAMGAVFVAAGWLALRRSRRLSRFWAAAGLVLLAVANVLDIQQRAGPWWPLIEQGWGLGEAFAVLVWLAVLALIYRARQRDRPLALAILAGGALVFVVGLAVAATAHSTHSGQVCLGQGTALGRWTASLRKLEPVLGADYTGVRAAHSLRAADGTIWQVRPEQRDNFAGGASPHAGAALVALWSGDLLAEIAALPGSPDCVSLTLTWRAFGQWPRYGAWALLLGALVLAARVMRQAWWRAGVLDRIGMRRADQGRGALPRGRDRLTWPPMALALACGLAAYVWQAPAPAPLPRTAIDGAALIAARQAKFGGSHQSNRWMVTADALARHGQFGDAATMLLGAVESEPANAEAWQALGDALYGHAGGRRGAAAELAYARAVKSAR
jgi:Cytochrome c-type biogenesis protein CcmF C-terminal